MRTFIWLLLAFATFSPAAAEDSKATHETNERPPSEEPRQYLVTGDSKAIREAKLASFNALVRLDRMRAAFLGDTLSYHVPDNRRHADAEINRLKLVDDLLWARVKAATLQTEIWRLEADLAAIEYQRARDEKIVSQDGNSRDAVLKETIERLRLRAESARFRADTGEDIDNVVPAATQ